jgi:hypothetical protein
VSTAGAPPAETTIADRLGRSRAAFEQLRALRPGVTAEWRRYTKTGPWTLKVAEGKRTFFYLTPGDGEFTVTLILGERATEAALAADDVPEVQKRALRDARPYQEGRGIRVPVRGTTDVPDVERLLAVKLGER